MTKTYVIAVIPAKKDSARLPQKNKVGIDGKPLLVHTINQAKASDWIKEIYISTDSDEIAQLAKKEGVKTLSRDASLCGETPLAHVYRDALIKINNVEISHLIGLQPDHPDRHVKIDDVIAYAIDKNLEDVFSVDEAGFKNGSFRFFKADALREGRVSVYAGTFQDAATNIHTKADLRLAEIRLKQKKTPLRLRINQKVISEDGPTFVIAEGACNHLCDMKLAKKMIDEAVTAGADAIKFQTYKAEKLVAKEAQSYWNYGNKISQYEYYKNLDKFEAKEYEELLVYGSKKGIVVFSTPFDVQSAHMLNQVGMPLFKIASCSITDLKLLRTVAQFKKPILLSTGGSTLDEIHEAVDTIYDEGNDQLVILACTLSYPTPAPDAHLRRIPTLKKEFPQAIIGLSDHVEPEPNMVVPAIGVSLGAKVIEKHYTLDRTLTGSGHAFSVDPVCLKKMIENIRMTETVLGTSELSVREVEKKARESARFTVVAAKDLTKGQLLKEGDLTIKRPGMGILPKDIDRIVGKRLLKDISVDQHLSWDDIEGHESQAQA